MHPAYNHTTIESKWQQHWLENKTFSAHVDTDKEKFYCLDMFPYPSGAGLHVGHPLGYTATDIICRLKRHQGYNVLHPIGWDAFGLPAENYAIKTGTHPAVSTKANIDNFRRQIQSLGFSYDWDREIDTTDPEYVKWTQWIFLELYKKGLAYEKSMPMNWCPECRVVVANEEVVDGKHERCGTPVERRLMRQWMLRITDYAQRLLDDLDLLDQWPERIKAMQRHWIGRSEGLELNFTVDATGDKLRVYTTRPDTLYGATYMVVAPEHPLIEKIVTPAHAEEVQAYRDSVASKSDLERTELAKEKTGVFTGAYAVNPVNNERLPIWVGDYVLMTYGTGAIMCVPGHDERDNEFAVKYNLPVRTVVQAPKNHPKDELYTGKEGTAIHSPMINGLDFPHAFDRIVQWAEKEGLGTKKVNFRLRDWVFSRNRYWGEPIPLIHTPEGALHLLDTDELPLTLPTVDDYTPQDSGQSPLDAATDWVNTPNGKRETLTMPNWAGSSWYWLRYMDPINDQEFCSNEAENYWGPVDLYVGGAEHAVLHLLYARFWHKVLFDLGHVSTPEPFLQLRNQGLILAEDGQKMSKSLGNVVNPDEIVASHGADTLRVYEMFMGPFDQPKQWSSGSLGGVRKFLERAWRVAHTPTDDTTTLDDETLRTLHQTIQLVTERIESFQFNTAVSQLMILTNALTGAKTLPKNVIETFVLLLSPFAPHMAEELWHGPLGQANTIAYASWPVPDPQYLTANTVTYAVQINGKVRADFTVSTDASKQDIVAQAKSLPNVTKYLEGSTIRKEIFVPGKIIGFVVS